MKKFALWLCVVALVISAMGTFAMADTYRIAIPDDATNEGRALLLLQSIGALTLKAGALAVKDPNTGSESFDKNALSTYSTVNPQIYALVVVLAPVEAEKPSTVTRSCAPSKVA